MGAAANRLPPASGGVDPSTPDDHCTRSGPLTAAGVGLAEAFRLQESAVLSWAPAAAAAAAAGEDDCLPAEGGGPCSAMTEATGMSAQFAP